ncbi:MAG: exodeoxyribonuclease III [Puniceicoccales bacterium]|jgi:exodeoxyribonuclease-3|nr:exodeoxyribonuclease III [Puniceicoccales bacterium]
MKIVSWNVNGLRAILAKNFEESLGCLDPDILCLQEIRAKPSQLAEGGFLHSLPFKYFHPAERPGYSGTAIFSKKSYPMLDRENTRGNGTFFEFPLPGIDTLIDPQEGRVQVADCSNSGGEDFFLVNVYTPNANGGGELERLEFRHGLWDPQFCSFLEHLRRLKPLIVCGDFNVAHREIDLAHPDQNRHSAGFTDGEREGFSRYIERGFVDVFRQFYPHRPNCYTWWSYRMHARQRNVGWRIDYFLASEEIASKIKNIEIHGHIMGSDHAPIAIEI